MRLSEVMDELAERLKVIPGLETYPYPADRVVIPAATIGYPDEVEYTQTFGGVDPQAAITRGIDAIELSVKVIEARNPDRARRIAQYLDGSGPMSVPATLEDHEYKSFTGIAVETARVEFDEYNGSPCIIARFTVSIEGGN